MITISNNQVSNILSEKFAYECVKKGIESQSKGYSYVMPRSTKSFGNNKLLADMSALIKDMGVFGIKHYVVHNSKFSYYIYLYDFSTSDADSKTISASVFYKVPSYHNINQLYYNL